MKHTLAATLFTLAICVLTHAQQTYPQDQSMPPATITGSGTANFIPLFTGTTTIGNSKLFQSGGNIGLGTTSPTVKFDVVGRINVSKSYRIGGSDVLITPSSDSVGLGVAALRLFNPVLGGGSNTAVGSSALASLVSGQEDTAVGAGALLSDTAGINTAVGNNAMIFSTTGEQNTACGGAALFNNLSGNQNTAVGTAAGQGNTTGNLNIAIGFTAGLNVAGGNSNNIHIASLGVSTDNGVVRIGTSGAQTSFFAAGISGVPTGLNNAVPVVVDSNGQIGTISSSRRYKEDIQDMGDASHGLMQLRPVTFRYQKPFQDGSKPIQYGLIAEEVEQVYPDLVAHSADGQVQAVKYQVLDSMLLNEVQRQQEEIRSLREELAKVEAAMGSIAHGAK